MAEKLQGVVCKIAAKTSDEDRLYGSITVRDIVRSLEKQNITVRKQMVLLSSPIKKIGAQKVPIRIYKDVEPEITIEVIPE